MEWTVQSDNESVARALKIGAKINVNGMALGSTRLTVLTSTGVRRTLPVQVYDPKVLDVGEIHIAYVDRFACRWSDAHAGADIHASFYHPTSLGGGWKALGSLGVIDARDCPSVNGKQWMMVVRADPVDADPVRPPLRPPVRFEKEWDDTGTGGDVLFGAFWTPICEPGYRAMGTVVTGGTTSAGRNPPALADATCVRADLTAPALATTKIWDDEGTGGDVRYQGSFALEASENYAYQTTTAYLTTGTFVTQGQLRSCSTEDCWDAPPLGARAVMNVLAVDLPLLIDAPRAATMPSLTGYDQPPSETEPLMAKAMLVPFTAIGSAESWRSRGTAWMVNNSPFVRADRVLRWGLEFWQYNSGSERQNPSKTFTKGISVTDSTTLSHTAGISVTAEGGVEFLGTGGRVSATVSYQFGYESQHAVGEFREESTTVTINVPPYKVAAAWQARSEIQVRLHNLTTFLLEPVKTVRMADSLYFVTDDYPD